MNSKNLKIILIVLIILTVLTLLEAFKYKCNNEAKRLYNQGVEFYKNENYSDAYYNFKQIKRASSIHSLALLKQFQCAIHLSDKKTAHSKIKELVKSTHEESIRPYVLYNEASLAQELGINSKNQSIRKYKYIRKTYPNSDFSIASAYKLARLVDDNKLSKENYVEYLSHAPNGKYSLSALEGASQDTNILTKEDREIVANAYFSNEQYDKALAFYQKASFSNNWNKIAKCYKKLNNQEAEKDTILRALELKKSEVDEKEISSAIDRLIVITNSSKIATLQNLYEKYPSSYIFPTVAYKLAQNSTSIRSIKLYELVANKFPDSYWASNSMWEVFWYNYKLQRYKTCEEIAQTHAKLHFDSTDAPRIAFWHGKVLLNEKRNLEAKDVFYKVAKNYPLSYYTFLSVKQLKSSKANKLLIKKPIVSYDINSINKFLFKDKILLMLAEQDDFQTIDELKINDEFIKSWIANKKENYPLSINIAKNALFDKENDSKNPDNKEKNKFQDYQLKLMYPVVWENEINSYASKFKISPYLFLSLVREESHFNSSAKSPVGALGLAQIMPDTASHIEKGPISNETLLNEKENIRIGLKYFSYLTDYFNQNEYLAILAYNAGPGNVNKWLNNSFIQSEEIETFVEDIPFIETKNYIKKILSSYWAYITIYSPKNK